MIIQDIALFKSFIESNTLREIFLRGYRKSATFSKNPSSVEEFLKNIEPENVIVKGITNFTTNSHFGYDFWQNANDSWLVFLNQGRKRHSYNDKDKLMKLDNMFKVLRENWDAAKAWLYESEEDTLVRLGLAESKSKEEEPKTPAKLFNPKFRVGDTVKGRISGDCCKIIEVNLEYQCYLTNDEGAIDFTRENLWDLVEPDIEDDLPDVDDFSGVPEYDDGLEFFDLNSGSRSSFTRLKKGEVSLNFRNKSYKIVFNQEDTKKLKKNEYKYVRLAKNKQGDIILQIHKIEGLTDTPVHLTFTSRNDTNYINAAINSKDLCSKLKTLLNLKGDYFVLKIEELLMDSNKANYKVTKK